ncbi:hypothetical protein B0H14DRAFT_3126822 [Mycena olivaceomarginata]|nr:hypothetical protein B0H14DRAFT_3126822 [Mycena olivaceomarginata]
MLWNLLFANGTSCQHTTGIPHLANTSQHLAIRNVKLGLACQTKRSSMSGHLGPIHHLPRQFHPRHSPQSLHTRHQLRELCALILRVLIRCHANVPELGVRVLPILPCKEVQNVIRRSHQTGEARKNGGRDRRAEGPDGDVEGEVERVDKRVAREEGREVRDGDGAIGTDGQARQSGESEAGQDSWSFSFHGIKRSGQLDGFGWKRDVIGITGIARVEKLGIAARDAGAAVRATGLGMLGMQCRNGRGSAGYGWIESKMSQLWKTNSEGIEIASCKDSVREAEPNVSILASPPLPTPMAERILKVLRVTERAGSTPENGFESSRSKWANIPGLGEVHKAVLVKVLRDDEEDFVG